MIAFGSLAQRGPRLVDLVGPEKVLIPDPDHAGIDWLDALDAPGSSAWDDLDRMRAELPDHHPVLRTVDFLQVDPVERRARSRPTLAYYAERAGSEPGAFARCVVEHFRDTDENSLERCRRLLVDRPALDALALAYQAWDSVAPHNARLLLHAMGRVLGDAVSPDALDPLSREILASIVEVEAEVCVRQGLHDVVADTLAWCRDWLDDCPIPGRSAEMLRRRARHLFTRRRFDEALELVERAEAEMPVDIDLEGRVDVVVLRAWCAYGAGHHTDAARHADRVEPLVEHWARPRHRGHLLFLRGLLAYRAERFEEADGHFVAADRVMSEHRLYDDLMQLRVKVHHLWKALRQEEPEGGTAEGGAIGE